MCVSPHHFRHQGYSVLKYIAIILKISLSVSKHFYQNICQNWHLPFLYFYSVLHFALERPAFKTIIYKCRGSNSWKTRFQEKHFHDTLQYIDLKLRGRLLKDNTLSRHWQSLPLCHIRSINGVPCMPWMLCHNSWKNPAAFKTHTLVNNSIVCEFSCAKRTVQNTGITALNLKRSLASSHFTEHLVPRYKRQCFCPMHFMINWST